MSIERDGIGHARNVERRASPIPSPGAVGPARVRIILGHDYDTATHEFGHDKQRGVLSPAMPLLRPVVVVVPRAQEVQGPNGRTVVRKADRGERVRGMARHMVARFVQHCAAVVGDDANSERQRPGEVAGSAYAWAMSNMTAPPASRASGCMRPNANASIDATEIA